VIYLAQDKSHVDLTFLQKQEDSLFDTPEKLTKKWKAKVTNQGG